MPSCHARTRMWCSEVETNPKRSQKLHWVVRPSERKRVTICNLFLWLDDLCISVLRDPGLMINLYVAWWKWAALSWNLLPWEALRLGKIWSKPSCMITKQKMKDQPRVFMQVEVIFTSFCNLVAGGRVCKNMFRHKCCCTQHASGGSFKSTNSNENNPDEKLSSIRKTYPGFLQSEDVWGQTDEREPTLRLQGLQLSARWGCTAIGAIHPNCQVALSNMESFERVSVNLREVSKSLNKSLLYHGS